MGMESNLDLCPLSPSIISIYEKTGRWKKLRRCKRCRQTIPPQEQGWLFHLDVFISEHKKPIQNLAEDINMSQRQT
jgi:hypothetical protein